VSEVTNECSVNLNKIVSKVNLNILPLGYYGLLVGMDWIEPHRAKVDCYDKTIECIDDDGYLQNIQGIPNPVSIRHISTL
jgi:hypothetical protein